MTNGSCLVLFSMINSPEWAKDTKTIYTAGKLSIRLNDVVETMPKTPEECREWEKQEANFKEMDSGEFQASVQAFQFFSGKGALRPSRWTVELQELLKLTA